MPLKLRRKTLKGKRTYGRGRKSFAKPKRMLRIKSDSGHFFKRTFVNTVSTSSAGVLGIGKVFQFSQVPGVAEFVALFDQYRINCVCMNLVWRSTGIGAIETAVNQQSSAPILYDVIDYDDGNAPANRQEIVEYNKHHITMYGTMRRTRKLKIYPRNANTVFRTGVSNAYAVASKGIWIDMAYTDVEYYGYKGWIDIQGTGVSMPINYFDIIYTFYFQCRDAR